jgi:hypothetical protein
MRTIRVGNIVLNGDFSEEAFGGILFGFIPCVYDPKTRYINIGSNSEQLYMYPFIVMNLVIGYCLQLFKIPVKIKSVETGVYYKIKL